VASDLDARRGKLHRFGLSLVMKDLRLRLLA
jgi:hypothetical protein